MKRVILFAIWLYKAAVSPFLPQSCRFAPSCSEYAAAAVEKHGALKGFSMAVWRLLRCHPFSEGGYDPVK
ncbi:membrane protein insertion efficiency factor YidD [Candidatus Magnetominusculus xianensis]|uniref:Putative membrane protein insertion efficiency factor n=1 Tax=Candidatus Magnetominusculus xianensis TaxID=1748249 RepID=A0ABR5SEZ6_9BACT|nr:membrane protein insertion efficiency factor YidD [Candidatus Magnetominusculus xianensis]KWT85318.1 putative membrane protein insertion efficiency factor [Candidatus Magnetominusculus xianensis]MBF0404830.1 membrane protein insertion efficiency factor YidD [Nitrospirota bacterium]